MNYYYTTEDGTTTELFETTSLILTNKKITKLVCPPCKLLDCSNNFIKTLTIPIGCESVYCVNNGLKIIEIPDSVFILKCSLNSLTSIKAKNLKILECYGNKINNLSINTSCYVLGINNFDFPIFIMKLLIGNKPQFDLGINLCKSLYKN